MIYGYNKAANKGVTSTLASLNINAVGVQNMSAHSVARCGLIPQPKVTCRVCGEVKPSEEYYPNHIRATGDVGECKDCTKSRVKRRAQTNPKVQEYDRNRAKLPHRRENARKVTKRWRDENPDVYRAQTAVGNAVRDGHLVKQPCLFCGDDKVHAHHRDYSKPLEVIWLCPKCHHRLHAAFPETEGANKAPETRA